MHSLVSPREAEFRASTPSVPAPTATPLAISPTGGSGWSHFPTWLRSPRLLLQLLSLAIGIVLCNVSPVIPPAQAASSAVLQRGSTCNSVRQLQVNLTRVGVYNGPISGYFGTQTESAVRRYQSTRGLRVDGIAGPATLATLNREVNGLVAVTPTTTVVTPLPIVTTTPVVTTTPIAAPTPIITGTLRRGDRGPAVTELQRGLRSVGVYNGPITGYFGDLTENAVILYQRRRGLIVNGIAGPTTLTTLAHDLNVVAIGYPNTGAPTLVPIVTPGSQVVTTTQVATTHYIATPGMVTSQVVTTAIPVQAATVPAAAVVTNPGAATWVRPTPITYGSAGGEVRAVQLQLRNLGFYNGPITGYFGPETQAAVYQYQRSRNIQPTGTIGPTTLSHLSREI